MLQKLLPLLKFEMILKMLFGGLFPLAFFAAGIYNFIVPTNATGVYAWIMLFGLSVFGAPALHLAVFEDEIRAAVGPIASHGRAFLTKRRALYFG